jgi:hypothetical protein
MYWKKILLFFVLIFVINIIVTMIFYKPADNSPILILDIGYTYFGFPAFLVKISNAGFTPSKWEFNFIKLFINIVWVAFASGALTMLFKNKKDKNISSDSNPSKIL